MLEINDLSFSYQDGSQRRLILDEINVRFEKGKFYTVCGQSGSGKTTFLSLLAASDTPEHGSIKYLDQDIQDIGLSKYRRNHIAMVFQQFNLVPYMTALQNVMLAQDISDNTKADKDEALRLLESVGIDNVKAMRNVKKLSGGEQQRVAIARALSTKVDIIIADEPTGNLDTKTQNEIIALLKDLSHTHNKCLIVVTHSNSVARQSDQSFTMSDGVLI